MNIEQYDTPSPARSRHLRVRLIHQLLVKKRAISAPILRQRIRFSEVGTSRLHVPMKMRTKTGSTAGTKNILWYRYVFKNICTNKLKKNQNYRTSTDNSDEEHTTKVKSRHRHSPVNRLERKVRYRLRRITCVYWKSTYTKSMMKVMSVIYVRLKRN